MDIGAAGNRTSDATTGAATQPATPPLRLRHGLIDRALFPLMVLLAALALCHGVVTVILSRVEQLEVEAGQHRVQARAEGAVVWLRRSLEGINISLDLLQKYHNLSQLQDPRAQAVEDVLHDMASTRRFDMVVAMNIAPSGVATFSTSHHVDPVRNPQRPPQRYVGPDPRRTYVSDPFIGNVTGVSVVAFTRHLFNLDGSDAGIASVTVDYLALSDHMREMLTSNGEAIGVSRDGGFLIMETRWSTQAEIKKVKPSPVVAQAIAGKASAFLRMPSTMIPGAEVLLCVTRVPEYDLIVAAAVDINEVVPWLPHRSAILALSDATAGLLTLIGLMLGRLVQTRRRVMRALRQVTRDAAQAAVIQNEINQSINALPGAIYRARLDVDGRFECLFISSAVERLTGWSVETISEMALGPFTFCVPEQTEAERVALAARIRAEEHVVQERQIRLANGHLRWIRISDQMVAQNDESVEFVGLITDIEVEQNAVASAKATARLAALGEVATGLAHEINQPIALISVSAENALAALQREHYEQAAEKMRRIPAMAARARVIMEHLRLFARQQNAEREDVAVAKAVQGALLLTESALKAENIKVEIVLPPDLPPVRAGQVLLEQVLLNLFLNARDAMRTTNRDERLLRVSAEPRGGQVDIHISDTGPGLTAEASERLFEPFFTTKAPGEGTGLGLSICAGIVTGFGGTITGGNYSGGANFTITLDAALPAE